MIDDGESAMTTAELIAALWQVGCCVTSEQLKRWSRVGALGRPTQRHRPGHRGSETVWPAGIGEQVVAVAGHARRLRSLDATLIATWWDDWPVDTNALLTVLVKGIETHPVWTFDRSGDEEARLDALDEIVRSADLSKARGPIAKALRRAGRSQEDRRSLLFAVGSVASGIEPLLETVDVGLDEPSLADILARGLALDSFAAQLNEAGEAVTTSDLVRDVVDMAKFLEPMAAHALEIVASANVVELSAARDQARALMLLSELAGAVLPVDPMNGLGLLGEQVQLDEPSGWLLALVLTLWFRSQVPENVAIVTSALADVAPQVRAFRAVLDRVPGLEELVKAAAGDNIALARLIDARPEVRASLDRFLGANPGIRAVLEG